MKNSFAEWCSKHPYTVTSLIFLAVILLGWRVLGWGERHLGFVLLLYFIVTFERMDLCVTGGLVGQPGCR